MSDPISGRGGSSAHAEPGEHGEPIPRLGTLLCEALRRLAAAGEPEEASRLAGEAWAATCTDAPEVAVRLNAVMHAIAVETGSEGPSATAMPPAGTLELDVRSDAPARRHELILGTYDRLAPGQGFVLVNDHDPKPLYYQFAAEHADEFTWEYLVAGPEVWKVHIGRRETA